MPTAMTLSRSSDDWALLLNEYNICKRKLESKREGLKILVKDFDRCQMEKELYKNKVGELQNEADHLREVLQNVCSNNNERGVLSERHLDQDSKALQRLLLLSQRENESLRNDLKTVKELYEESQKDKILLRDSVCKHNATKKMELAEEVAKERLISQMEEAQSLISSLRRELELAAEQRELLETERDALKEKLLRLNKELNFVLHNDDRRIIDVDSLLLENRYMKEVVKQYKEEKAVALTTVARYKEALGSHTAKATGRLSFLDLHVPKASANSETMAQLQLVNKSLTEKLSEKETALKHQRNANRILGNRVSELEKKLKTLELSGLWSIQGQKGAVSRHEISEQDLSPLQARGIRGKESPIESDFAFECNLQQSQAATKIYLKPHKDDGERQGSITMCHNCSSDGGISDTSGHSQVNVS